MAANKCEVCHNKYINCIEVKMKGRTHTFDCFECAIHALAPTCHHCGCRVIGHGVEAQGVTYCGAHCAHEEGHHTIKDQEGPSLMF